MASDGTAASQPLTGLSTASARFSNVADATEPDACDCSVTRADQAPPYARQASHSNSVRRRSLLGAAASRPWRGVTL